MSIAKPIGRLDYMPRFEEEFCVPSQFFSKQDIETPEKKLAAAVLETSVRDFMMQYSSQAKTKKWQRLAKAASKDITNWFFSPPNPDYVFSFPSLCDILNLEPDYIRSNLRAYALKPRKGFTFRRVMAR